MQEQKQGRGPAPGFRGDFPLLRSHSQALPCGPKVASVRPGRGSRPCLGPWARGGAAARFCDPDPSSLEPPPGCGPGGARASLAGQPPAPGPCSPRSDSGGSSPTRTRGAPAQIPSTPAPGCEWGSPAAPRPRPTAGKRGAPGQAQHACARAQLAGKSWWGWGCGGCRSFWELFHLRFHNPAVPPTESGGQGGRAPPTTPDCWLRRCPGGLELQLSSS